MIAIAKEEHIPILAVMLHNMYKELFGAEATDDMNVYVTEVIKHYNNPKDTVYIDELFRGFFVVRDETESMTPNLHRYNGIRVYIREDSRKGRLLTEFYARLFNDFPNGDIIGVTEIGSEHIAVLDKRHEKIANMYKLNREKV